MFFELEPYDQEPLQEHIDKYLASCKRSSSTSSDALDADEDEELGDDEQSKAEFAAFQEWLAKNEMDRQPIPKPSDPPRCEECGWAPCRCISTWYSGLFTMSRL